MGERRRPRIIERLKTMREKYQKKLDACKGYFDEPTEHYRQNLELDVEALTYAIESLETDERYMIIFEGEGEE